MTERKQTNRKLELELERLKSVLDMAHELRLEWSPGRVRRFDGRRLSGEVLGEVIHVYEESEPKALRTLKHEFIEYVLANEFTEPYRRMINALVMAFEREARHRKERVVERLSDVI
ncbi:unnamed protein product [marine sediment metagenome]|uniref:Uncharacterized protein n=1 Tax=marine sediment metagenome TaxID=412755 RepID=X1P1J9_9ZZZZ